MIHVWSSMTPMCIPRCVNMSTLWFPSDCDMIFRWPYTSSPFLNKVFFKHVSWSAHFQYFSIDALAIKLFPLDSRGQRFTSKNSVGVPPEAFRVILTMTLHFCYNRAKWQLLFLHVKIASSSQLNLQISKQLMCDSRYPCLQADCLTKP